LKIIFSGGVKPSAYILAAYGGQFGPNVDLTITQDEEEFKTKLDTLYASGADEVVFQALQVSWYSTEGQLISKCPFGVFKSTKNQQKFYKDFCPSL
jgi:hypothetical protein